MSSSQEKGENVKTSLRKLFWLTFVALVAPIAVISYILLSIPYLFFFGLAIGCSLDAAACP